MTALLCLALAALGTLLYSLIGLALDDSVLSFGRSVPLKNRT